MSEKLKGKIVLVTGGGRGLGEAICRNLAKVGATVWVADVRSELAERVASEARDQGGDARAIRLDVGDDSSVADVMERISRESDGLDVLINNAGVDVTLPLDELSIAEWDRIMKTNLRGPFVMAKHVLPAMRKRSRGHIVNIVSTAAKRAWANASAYHASKWGLLGFSHALHVEARPHNVKVTAMICGGMRTPFLLERFPDIDLNNLQDPADVAETVRYILSAPQGTVIPEIMALPMRETSWP